MGNPVAREGDMTACGAQLKATQETVYVDGRKVIRKGDPILHGGPLGQVSKGSNNFFVEGKEVARVGDQCFCYLHGPVPIIKGSETTFNGDV